MSEKNAMVKKIVPEVPAINSVDVSGPLAELLDARNWNILSAYGLGSAIATEAATLASIYRANEKPADQDFVRILLGKLLVHLPDRNRPEDADTMVFDDYLRVLKYPADIWQAGYDEVLRKHIWFPKIAGLHAIMAPMLTERINRRTRLQMIAQFAKMPKRLIKSPEESGAVRQAAGLRRITNIWPKVRAALTRKAI